LDGMKILGFVVVEEAGCLNVPKFDLVLHDVLLESIKVAVVLDKSVGLIDKQGDELSNLMDSG